MFNLLNFEDQDTALLLLKARFNQVAIKDVSVNNVLAKDILAKNVPVNDVLAKDVLSKEVHAKEEDRPKFEEAVQENFQSVKLEANEKEELCEANINESPMKLDDSVKLFEKQKSRIEEQIQLKSENLTHLNDTITLFEQEKFEIEEKIKFFDDMAKIELDQSYRNSPRNRQTLSSQDSLKTPIGLECQKCGFQTSLHTNLRVHMADKHPVLNQSLASLKRSMCDMCMVASDRTCDMDEYMETRSLDESCQFCSFEYPQIPKTKYIRTSFVANFECEKCEFSTTQKGTLHKHTMNEHGWLDGWLFS